jgi:iduronate 2-sulfatase
MTSRILSLIFLAVAGVASAAPKNVLLICVDDLKPVLGCYGDKVAKTPNIDKLANRGLVMEAAYCNQAVCAPSRHALMVGVRPQRLGIYDLETNFRRSMPDAKTLGQVMQANGYKAEAMGKIFHHGHGNEEDAATWSVPHWGPRAGAYQLKESQPKLTEADKKKPKHLRSRGPAFEAAPVADNQYPDGQVAEEATKRIAAAKQTPEQPFFIAVGFVKPHLPFNSPQKYWDLYKAEEMPLADVTTAPVEAPSYAPQAGGELRQYRDIPGRGPMPTELQRKLIHGYYAATSYMDAQVGLVLDALEKNGLADSTLVILWGDHGWHLGDHGIWCKHTNYEQATRIPLLLAGPGVKSGRSNALVETVDLFPTVLAWAGAKKPAPEGQLDGKSFLPVVTEGAATHRDHAIHVYPRWPKLGRAVRTATHRLVEWKSPGAESSTAEYELYDYVADAKDGARHARRSQTAAGD